MTFADLKVGDLFRFPMDRAVWRKVRGKFCAVTTPTDESMEIASVLCGKAVPESHKLTIYVKGMKIASVPCGKAVSESHKLTIYVRLTDRVEKLPY